MGNFDLEILMKVQEMLKRVKKYDEVVMKTVKTAISFSRTNSL